MILMPQAIWAMQMEDEVTYGVALSNTESLEEGDNFVLVTNGGVRLQAGSFRIYATDSEIVLGVKGGNELKITNDGVFVNGTSIS